jgi:hypothetical protein
LPARQVGGGELFNDQRKAIGIGGQIEEAVAAEPMLLLHFMQTLGKFAVTLRGGEVGPMVEDVPGKAVPGFPVPGVHAAVFLGGVTKFVTELAIVLVAPTHSNDDERRAEEVPVPKAEQRRKQFAVSQSPRGTENDQGERLRHLHEGRSGSAYLLRRLGLNDLRSCHWVAFV